MYAVRLISTGEFLSHKDSGRGVPCLYARRHNACAAARRRGLSFHEVQILEVEVHTQKARLYSNSVSVRNLAHALHRRANNFGRWQDYISPAMTMLKFTAADLLFSELVA